MEPFARLMFAAAMRRAMSLQAWMERHVDCYPGVQQAYNSDPFTQSIACSCGERADFTVVVSTTTQVLAK